MTEIRVNAAQWNALPETVRQKVICDLRKSGILKAGDTVVGDASVNPFESTGRHGTPLPGSAPWSPPDLKRPPH